MSGNQPFEMFSCLGYDKRQFHKPPRTILQLNEEIIGAIQRFFHVLTVVATTDAAQDTVLVSSLPPQLRLEIASMGSISDGDDGAVSINSIKSFVGRICANFVSCDETIQKRANAHVRHLMVTVEAVVFSECKCQSEDDIQDDQRFIGDVPQKVGAAAPMPNIDLSVPQRIHEDETEIFHVDPKTRKALQNFLLDYFFGGDVLDPALLEDEINRLGEVWDFFDVDSQDTRNSISREKLVRGFTCAAIHYIATDEICQSVIRDYVLRMLRHATAKIMPRMDETLIRSLTAGEEIEYLDDDTPRKARFLCILSDSQVEVQREDSTRVCLKFSELFVALSDMSSTVSPSRIGPFSSQPETSLHSSNKIERYRTRSDSRMDCTDEDDDEVADHESNAEAKGESKGESSRQYDDDAKRNSKGEYEDKSSGSLGVRNGYVELNNNAALGSGGDDDDSNLREMGSGESVAQAVVAPAEVPPITAHDAFILSALRERLGDGYKMNMQHLPTPKSDDEFNLYLNVDRRQVWFYFDKVDYGVSFLDFMTEDFLGGGPDVVAQCQSFACAREVNRCFYLHLAVGTGIHPFALQALFRQSATDILSRPEEENCWLFGECLRAVPEESGFPPGLLSRGGEFVDATTMMCIWPEELDELRVMVCKLNSESILEHYTVFEPMHDRYKDEKGKWAGKDVIMTNQHGHFTLMRQSPRPGFPIEERPITRLLDAATKAAEQHPGTAEPQVYGVQLPQTRYRVTRIGADVPSGPDELQADPFRAVVGPTAMAAFAGAAPENGVHGPHQYHRYEQETEGKGGEMWPTQVPHSADDDVTVPPTTSVYFNGGHTL